MEIKEKFLAWLAKDQRERDMIPDKRLQRAGNRNSANPVVGLRFAIWNVARVMHR